MGGVETPVHSTATLKSPLGFERRKKNQYATLTVTIFHFFIIIILETAGRLMTVHNVLIVNYDIYYTCKVINLTVFKETLENKCR